MRPDTSLPIADPSVENVTYQASTSALVCGVVKWDRIDSSMDLKGPVSVISVYQRMLQQSDVATEDFVILLTKVASSNTDNSKYG